MIDKLTWYSGVNLLKAVKEKGLYSPTLFLLIAAVLKAKEEGLTNKELKAMFAEVTKFKPEEHKLDREKVLKSLGY